MPSAKPVTIAGMRALRFVVLAGTLTGSALAAAYLWQPLVSTPSATRYLAEPALQPAGESAAAAAPISVAVTPPAPPPPPKPARRPAARPQPTIVIAPTIHPGSGLLTVPGLGVRASGPLLPKSTPIVVHPINPNSTAPPELPKIVTVP